MGRLDRQELAAVWAGGAVGAVARAALTTSGVGAPPGFPWLTLAINVLGAALLGYLVTRLQERLPLSSYRRPLLGTGFCGAFTTFSTVQVELLGLLDAGRWALAGAYVAASVGLGLLAVHLTTAAVRRVRQI
jgi:CrcB protein